jgi:hypothetical protein
MANASIAMPLAVLALLGCSSNSDAPDITTPPPQDPSLVGPTGGAVTADGGRVQVVVPSGALTSQARITVEPNGAATSAQEVGAAWTFGPSGTQFANPITLRLRYDDNAFPAGTDLTKLKLARLENGTWVPRGEDVSVNLASRELSGKVRSFSTWGIWSDPCAPFRLEPLTQQAAGALTTGGCRFESAGVSRFTRYWTVNTSAPTGFELQWSTSYNIVAGLKEATENPALGNVWGAQSGVAGTALVQRFVLPAGSWQIYLSGADTTQVGPYTLTSRTRSLGEITSGNGCQQLVFMVPGARVLNGALDRSTGDCETTVAFNPDPRWIGRPLLIERFAARLIAGRQYSVTGSFGSGQGVSALTVFLGNALVGQQFLGQEGGVRTINIIPTTTAYYTLEVSSSNPLGVDGPLPVTTYELTLSDGGMSAARVP